MSKQPRASLKDIASGVAMLPAAASEPAVDLEPASPAAPAADPATRETVAAKEQPRSTPSPSVVKMAPRRAATAEKPAAKPTGQGTLKTRTRQLTIYLEPPVYEQLRELGFTERKKLHGLLLEALDFYFVKKKGLKSIADLTEGEEQQRA